MTREGRIASVNVSDGGVPKLPVGAAVVAPGGVAGDRQRDLRHHGGPDRAVCVYALELISALREEGHPIDVGTTIVALDPIEAVRSRGRSRRPSMNYKLLAATLAFLLPLGCGGGSSSTTKPGDSVAAPASGGAPATPSPSAAPGTGAPPAAPADAPPTGPAAGASPSGPASPAAAPGEASCSETFNFANNRAEYDESCTEGGKTRSRECTVESGESVWSCMCTAASGSRSTCQAPMPRPGVFTAPDDCCPAP